MQAHLARFVLRRLLVAAGLLAASACTGCTHVIAGDTPYYNEGPLQSGLPDGELRAGTGVWIVGDKDGYKRIWALEGVLAYVWPRAIVTRAEWNRIQKMQAEADKAEREALSSPASTRPAPTRR